MKAIRLLYIAIFAAIFESSNCSTSIDTTPLAVDSEMCEKLKEAFDGRRPLYAITVTRTGSEVLTPVDIHVIFAVLRELFGLHDDNHVHNLAQSMEFTDKISEKKYDPKLDNSFLETSHEFSKSSNRVDNFTELRHVIEEATSKYYSKKENLDKIGSNLQLIVFNEYFFGGKVGFANDYLENILYKHTIHFPNSIFFVNLLRQSLQQTSILELDRSISILSSPLYFHETAELIKSQHYMEQRHDLWAWITGIDNIIRNHNRIFPRLLQYEIRETKTGGVKEGTIQRWINFLLALKEQTYTQEFIHPCLENISISIFQNKPLTFYRKSTYANEFTKLTFSDVQDKWFLYLFGNGTDLLLNDQDQLARTLWQNISSEICLDLGCSIRSKNGIHKNVHIIQSNYIKLKGQLEKALPPCTHVLHADPYHASCYSFDSDKKELVDKTIVFQHSFIMNGETYVIKIFEIN